MSPMMKNFNGDFSVETKYHGLMTNNFIAKAFGCHIKAIKGKEKKNFPLLVITKMTTFKTNVKLMKYIG